MTFINNIGSIPLISSENTLTVQSSVYKTNHLEIVLTTDPSIVSDLSLRRIIHLGALTENFPQELFSTVQRTVNEKFERNQELFQLLKDESTIKIDPSTSSVILDINFDGPLAIKIQEIEHGITSSLRGEEISPTIIRNLIHEYISEEIAPKLFWEKEYDELSTLQKTLQNDLETIKFKPRKQAKKILKSAIESNHAFMETRKKNQGIGSHLCELQSLILHSEGLHQAFLSPSIERSIPEALDEISSSSRLLVQKLVGNVYQQITLFSFQERDRRQSDFFQINTPEIFKLHAKMAQIEAEIALTEVDAHDIDESYETTKNEIETLYQAARFQLAYEPLKNTFNQLLLEPEKLIENTDILFQTLDKLHSLVARSFEKMPPGPIKNSLIKKCSTQIGIFTDKWISELQNKAAQQQLKSRYVDHLVRKLAESEEKITKLSLSSEFNAPLNRFKKGLEYLETTINPSSQRSLAERVQEDPLNALKSTALIGTNALTRLSSSFYHLAAGTGSSLVQLISQTSEVIDPSKLSQPSVPVKRLDMQSLRVDQFFRHHLNPDVIQFREQFLKKIQSSELQPHIAQLIERQHEQLNQVIDDLQAKYQLIYPWAYVANEIYGAKLEEVQTYEESLQAIGLLLKNSPASDATHTNIHEWLEKTDQEMLHATSLITQSLPVEIKQIQQNKSKVETLRDFIENHPIDGFNDRMLLHFCLDVSGKQTGLEGAHYLDILEITRKLFEAQQKAHAVGSKEPEKQTTEIAAHIQQLTKARDIGYAISSKSVKELRGLLAKNLDALSEGDSFYFPGGWTGIPSGHAMYYEVTKQKEGTFSFRIYNTGAGLELHAKQSDEQSSLYLYFDEKSGISKESLLSVPFLKALQELQKPIDKEKETSTNEWGQQDIYYLLQQGLGGEFAKIAYSSEALRKGQISGTCAFMSLSAVLSENIVFKHPNRLKLEFELKAAVEYMRKYESILPHEEKQRNLFEKSLIQISNHAIACEKEGLIDNLELIYIQEKISSLNQQLIDAKQHRLLSLSEAKWSAPLVPLTEDFQKKGDMNVVPTQPSTAKKIENLSLDFVPLNDLKLTPQTLISDLAQLCKWSTTTLKSQNPAPRIFISHTLQKVISQLSVQWKDVHGNDQWAVFSDAEKIKLIEQLSELTKISMHTVVTINQGLERPMLDPRTLLMHWKTAAIAHKLLSLSKDPDHVALFQTGLFGPPSDLGPLNYPLYFRLYDPSLDKELSEIVTYWKATDHQKGTISQVYPLVTKTEHAIWGSLDANPLLVSWTKEQIVRLNLSERIDKAISKSPPKDEDPELAEISEGMRVLVALIDDVQFKHRNGILRSSRDLLPNYFYAMRDLFLFTEALEITPLDSKNLKPDHPVLIWTQSGRGGATYASFYNTMTSRYDKQDLDELRVISGTVLQHAHQAFINSKYKAIAQNRVHSSYKDSKISINLTANRMDRKDEEKTIATNVPEEFVSEEKYRDYCALFCNKELQIKEILSHCLKTPQFFNDPDDRLMFELTFFDPGALENALIENGPEMIAVFADFIVRTYQAQVVLGNIEIAAYFLGLNEQIKSYLSHIHESSIRLDEEKKSLLTPIITSLLDSQKQLRLLLAKGNLDEMSKHQLSQQLILSYHGRDQFSEPELKEIFAAACIMQQFKEAELSESSHKKLACQHIMVEANLQLKEMLKDNNKASDILNSIYSHVCSLIDIEKKSVPASWEPNPNFPYYKTTDGKIHVDLLRYEFISDDTAVKAIPKSICDDPQFIKHFGKPFNQTIKKLENDPNSYYFDFQKNTYRIIRDGKEIKIQRQFSIDHTTVWAEYSAKLQDTLIDATEIYSLVQNHDHWITLDKKNVIVTHQKASTRDPVYYISLRLDNLNKASVAEVRPINENGDLERAQLSPLQAPWDFLKNFEAPQYILCWKNPDTSLLEKLQLPRFGETGLNFKIIHHQGEERAMSQEFPGFFIAKKQFLTDLDSSSYSLLLENEAGEQKLILADQLLLREKKNEKNSLEPSRFSVDQKINKDILHPQNFFVYKIDKKTRKIIPTNDLGRLYLSMRYLWKMNYKKAIDTLTGTGSSLRAYTEDEKQILNEIFQFRTVTEDHDPRAFTVSLHAAYLLIKDHKNFQTKLSFDLDELKTLYIQYLNTREYALETQLDEDEIALIRSYLGISPSKEKKEKDFYHQTTNVNPYESCSLTNNDFYLENLNFCFSISHKSTANRILRPAPLSNLQNLYQLAKNELNDQKRNSVFEQFLAISIPEVTDWKKELINALKLQLAHSPQDISLMLLLAVAQHPEKFPSYNELQRMLDALTDKDKKTPLPDSMQEAIRQTIEDLKQSHQHTSKGFTTEPKRTDRDVLRHLRNDGVTKQARASMPLGTFVKPHSEFPMIANFGNIIERRFDPSKKTTVSYEQLIRHLTLGGAKTKDEMIAEEFSKVTASLRKYEEASKQEEGILIIKNQEEFEALSQQLVSKEDSFLRKMETMERSLCTLANKTAEHRIQKASENITTIGTGKTPLTIEDLVQLFWRNDGTLYTQQNSNLSPSDIETLRQGILNYLVSATEWQHTRRITAKISEIKKAQTKHASLEEQGELIKQLHEMGTAVPKYSFEKHPEYLVLEHAMNIQLRPEQIKKLDELNIKNGKIENPSLLGVVIEMLMGSGKTSVILSLLGILNADGEQLAISIIPEHLLAAMAEEIADRQSINFKQSIQVMEFTRHTHIDYQSLENILNRLDKMRIDKQMVLMSDSSLKSLYLKCVEHIDRLSQSVSLEEQQHLGNEITLFRKIFKEIFKQNGSSILDEIDLITNPRHEHHFTGGKPGQVDPLEIQCIADLYEIALTDPEITGKVSFDFSSDDAKGTVLTDETYQRKVKPNLIKKIIKHWLASPQTAIGAYLQTDTANRKKNIEQYLSNNFDLSTYGSIQDIQNGSIKDLLALAKEEINVLFPLTFNKLVNIHYGATEEHPLSLPFHGSNSPALGSEFGSYFEIINYTIQFYFKKGISLTAIKTLVEEIKNNIEKEHKISKNKGIKELDAYQEFVSLCGTDTSIDLFDQNADATIKKIQDKINSTPALLLKFIKKYHLSEIQTYPYTLNANPQIFSFLFKLLVGFTGTQWNPETLPFGLKAIPSDIIIGKTLGVLWANSQGKVHPLKKSNGSEFIKEFYSNVPDAHQGCAFIDTAGKLRHFKNDAAARLIYDEVSTKTRTVPLKGVVFYNDKGKLMAMGPKGKCTPFSQANLTPEEYITIYDQRHTTGADIVQMKQGVAFLSINQHTTLRDLLQSVWRMRGLVDKGQRIEFLIDDEAKTIIESKLHQFLQRPITGSLSLEDLMTYTIFNQAQLKGDNNYRSLKQKMWGTLVKTAFEVFMENAPAEETKKLFNGVREIFITETNTSPWKLFSTLVESVEKADALAQDIHDVKESKACKTLIALGHLTEKGIQKTLDELVNEADKTLPLKLSKPSRNSYGLEVEVETEAEKEKETEKETELEREIEKTTQSHKETRTPRKHIPVPSTFGFNWKSDLGSTQTSFVNHIDSALKTQMSLKGYVDIFEPHLLGSCNFQSQQDKAAYVPFDRYQKKATGLLMVEDVSTHEFYAVMLDQQDFCDLSKHPMMQKQTKDYRCCLYDFQLGPIKQSNQPLTQAGLSSDPKSLKLIVQAKFFNGHTTYTEEEIPHLKAWIKEIGKEKMKELFVKHILLWKKESKTHYSGSILEKLLNI